MQPHPGSGDLDPNYPGSMRVMPHNELALVSGSRNSDHKGTAVFGSFGGTCEGLRRKTQQQEELINHVDT